MMIFSIMRFRPDLTATMVGLGLAEQFAYAPNFSASLFRSLIRLL